MFENPYKYNFKTKGILLIITKKTIQTIGNVGNVISKNRESLLSINRLLIFYNQIDHAQGMTKET